VINRRYAHGSYPEKSSGYPVTDLERRAELEDDEQQFIRCRS
jgi:hypothetical protein